MARNSNKTQVPAPAKVEAEAIQEQTKKAGNNPTVVVALNRATGIRFPMPDGRQVIINGNAADLRGKEKGTLPIGGFGLTTIAAADWDYIKKTYGRMEIFEKGLLFAHERKADAVDEADEKKDTRHGLEPVEVETPNTEPATA